jgi:guanylate kinase
MANGAILVLSGPSGAGKSTIIEAASSEIGEYYFSISTTTRAPRSGEMHGREYYFVSKEEFEQGIKKGEFLEYAKVHDNYYGTSLKPVKEALNSGKLVIFDIDVQGHRLVRDALGDLVVSAFITPPTLNELKKRLSSRATDSSEIIAKRLQNAKDEIKALSEYDYIIINDKIEDAKEAFVAIANSARYKMSKDDKDALIKGWLEA